MMDARSEPTLQARLNHMNLQAIPFGSPNPVSGRGRFGNLDFVVLYLARWGAQRRRSINVQWSCWREIKLNQTPRYVDNKRVFETLERNAAASLTLGMMLNSCKSREYTGKNRYFKPDEKRGTWQLSADGWARAIELIKALTPEFPE